MEVISNQLYGGILLLKRTTMKRTSVILGIIQCVVAAGAIPVGLSMVLQPDGSGVGMSTDLLRASPFPNFLIPGLFLLIINGILNVAGAVLSFRRNRYTGEIGLLLGISLLLWMCVQIYFVGLLFFLQPLFFIVALIEIALSLYYRSKTQALQMPFQ
jgi:hypothetical protein